MIERRFIFVQHGGTTAAMGLRLFRSGGVMISLTICRSGKAERAGSETARVAAALRANLLLCWLFDYALARRDGESFVKYRERWDAIEGVLHEELFCVSQAGIISENRENCDICCLPRAVKILARVRLFDAVEEFLEATRQVDAESIFRRMTFDMTPAFELSLFESIPLSPRDEGIVSRAQAMTELLHIVKGGAIGRSGEMRLLAPASEETTDWAEDDGEVAGDELLRLALEKLDKKRRAGFRILE